MHGRLVTGALAWLCALVAIAASASLSWLLAAAGAFLAWLLFHRQRTAPGPRFPRMSMATIVSLVSYALLLSIALLTVRAALGLLELPVVPFEPAAFAPGMQRASVGYYDKSELHRALLELAALTVLFAIVFVRLAGDWMRQRGEPLVLHPLSAAFAFVLYFASVRLPPYPVDPGYWYPLAAAAMQVRAGEWPSFLADPLRPNLLGVWIWAFGLSALSLGAAATICNLAAGLASFALVRRLTGSRAVALLGASYLLLEATATHADRLTFPAPAHAALAMLLLHLSQRARGERTWPAFFFGLTLAWDVLFGLFAAIGFALAHRGRIRHARPAGLALCAGIGASLVAALLAHRTFALQGDAAPIVEKILASPPQEAGPESLLPFLLLLVPVFVLVALASRRRETSRQWSARSLFAGATLLCAIPYACLAAARADPSYAYSIQWVLLPAAALALHGAVRAIVQKGRFGVPRRLGTTLSLGTSALVLVICFDLFFPIDRLNRVLARYATAYESERATWYRQCAQGLACDPGAKPTLAHYLRHASQPLRLDRETTRGI
jgi:hypothetical protein